MRRGEAFGEVEGERGLAAGRRAENQDEVRAAEQGRDAAFSGAGAAQERIRGLSSGMERVRIGYVRYLNTLPLVEGLGVWEGVELVAAVPSRLAPMLATGEVDVALASLIDAAGAEAGSGRVRAPGGFTLLPVGMIGCDGPTMTVRLYSGVPLERVRTVHVDTDSHTSAVLCAVVLERLYGVRPVLGGFDAREHAVVGGSAGAAPAVPSAPPGPDGWPETVLLIGDKVVTDAPPSERYPHQLDLGDAWHRLTGLPFVYAAWMCREGEEGTPAVRHAARVLDRQRRRNVMRLDWLVERHARERGWPPELARRYVGDCLRYEVGAREREGAERFVREARALGLVPGRAGALRWADELLPA